MKESRVVNQSNRMHTKFVDIEIYFEYPGSRCCLFHRGSPLFVLRVEASRLLLLVVAFACVSIVYVITSMKVWLVVMLVMVLLFLRGYITFTSR